MSKPIETDRASARVTVAGIEPGEPPSITTVHTGTDRGGQRHFVQQVPILDRSLFARLSNEVNEGDEITVTVVNEWYETSHVTYLTDFKKVSPENIKDKDVVRVVLTPLVAESEHLEYVTSRLVELGFEHQHDHSWRTPEGALEAEVKLDARTSVNEVALSSYAQHRQAGTPLLSIVACRLAHGGNMRVSHEGNTLTCKPGQQHPEQQNNEFCEACDVLDYAEDRAARNFPFTQKLSVVGEN